MAEARYEIKKLLGKGRTGGVYEAEDLNLQRKVAMRRFFDQGNKVDFSDHKEKFIEVAQSLSNLQHPNIIKVFDAGIDEDGAYVVSQLLEGDSLHEEIKKGAMDVPVVVNIARQLLDGFIAAHDQEYFHGALTPDSIFMTASTRGGFRYIITDLGLARLAPLIQGEGTLLAFMADPAILAPELFDGGESSAQSDLYMLGNILYMSLAGGHPFGGLDNDEAKVKHEAGLSSIDKYNKDMPQSLVAWLNKMTAPAPADRPASALEALDELNAIQSGPIKVNSQPEHGAPLMQAASKENVNLPDNQGVGNGPRSPRLATSPVPITAPGAKPSTVLAPILATGEPVAVMAPGVNIGTTPHPILASNTQSLITAAPGTTPLAVIPPGTKPLLTGPLGTGPLGVVPQGTGTSALGVPSHLQQAPAQRPHLGSRVHVTQKKSASSLLIGIVALVVVAGVAIFAIMGEAKAPNNKNNFEDNSGEETISDSGANPSIIASSGTSSTSEKIVLFDASSPESSGWNLRSPVSQMVDKKQGAWLIRDRSLHFTSGARCPLKLATNKMFDKGWRITYKMRFGRGYNKFGFILSDQMNPGWLDGGALACYVVVHSTKDQSMVYTPNKDPKTFKKGKIYTKKRTKNWLTITIEQKANSVEGYYTVKVDGVTAYTDTFSQGLKLEDDAHWANHLFTSSLGKRDKSEWLIKDFTLEAL